MRRAVPLSFVLGLLAEVIGVGPAAAPPRADIEPGAAQFPRPGPHFTTFA